MHEFCEGSKEMKLLYFEATTEELRANTTLAQKLSQALSSIPINLGAESSSDSEEDDHED